MKRFRSFFSAVFFVATLLSAMHHHNDFKSHSDCKVCTIQHSLSSGDVPSEPFSVEELDLFGEKIISQGKNLYLSTLQLHNKARAPPHIS